MLSGGFIHKKFIWKIFYIDIKYWNLQKVIKQLIELQVMYADNNNNANVLNMMYGKEMWTKECLHAITS